MRLSMFGGSCIVTHELSQHPNSCFKHFLCLHAKTVTILSIFSMFLLWSLSYSICKGCLFDLIISTTIIPPFWMQKVDVLSRVHAVEHRNKCKKRLFVREFLISDTHSIFNTQVTWKNRGFGVLGYCSQDNGIIIWTSRNHQQLQWESNSPSGQTHQTHLPWSATTTTSSLPPTPVAMAPQRWERCKKRRNSNESGGWRSKSSETKRRDVVKGEVIKGLN